MWLKKKIIVISDDLKSDGIQISKNDYLKLMDSKSSSMIFTISQTRLSDKSQVRISDKSQVRILSRIIDFHSDCDNIIYIPSWMKDYLNLEQTINLVQMKHIPKAKYVKIVLDEQNGELYTPETNAIFENAISKYGCIKLGSTIPLYLSEIETTVFGYIEHIEVEENEMEDKDGFIRFDGEITFDIQIKSKLPDLTNLNSIKPSVEEETFKPSIEELRQLRLKKFLNL